MTTLSTLYGFANKHPFESGVVKVKTIVSAIEGLSLIVSVATTTPYW
jgi:hypothetical protein